MSGLKKKHVPCISQERNGGHEKSRQISGEQEKDKELY